MSGFDQKTCYTWRDGAIVLDWDGSEYECLYSDDPWAQPPWLPFGTTTKVPNEMYPMNFSKGDSLEHWMGQGTQNQSSGVLRILQKKRPRSIESGIMMAATAVEYNPKKPDSPWNGKCSKCGKGTYAGLLSLEHEGGECR